MEVERYYYAVASFMRKDDKISVTSVTCSVKGEETNTHSQLVFATFRKKKKKGKSICTHHLERT